MLHFKPIELSDKQVINNYLKKQGATLFTYCFEVLWLWRNVFEFQFAICQQNELLFIKTYTNGMHYFLFPQGSKNPKACINIILNSAKSIGCEPTIGQITPENKLLIENLFPTQFEILPNRNEFEYIYSCEKLRTLSGKKMQHKRNNINFLTKQYQWKLEPISNQNRDECLSFSRHWDNKLHGDFIENRAFYEAMDHLDTLELDAAALRINGKIEALSIGCPLNSEMYLILFEKANPETRGIYSLINKEFVNRFCEKYKWINRAEDGGIEGIRQAKLSYHPDILQEIFLAKKRKE